METPRLKSGCIRVLCLDDYEVGLVARKFLLESFGFEVQVTSKPQECLRTVANSAPDILVLDYRMPHMDGGQVAAKVRRICPHLPIIMLSGYAKEIPQQVLDLVDIFLLKGDPPFNLIAAIQSVVGVEIRKPPRSVDFLGQTQKHLGASRTLSRRIEERLKSSSRKGQLG